jgi:hypothetical protein
MKAKMCLCITLAVFVCICCTSKREVTYVFPEAMLPNVKVAYKEQCDKGKVLFDLNCASCHVKVSGRKKVMPDFKEEQLKGYELRVANAQHANSLPDERVTEEELGLIMVFLKYKRPTNTATSN